MTKANIHFHSDWQECLISTAKKTIAVRSAWVAANRGGGSGERLSFAMPDVDSAR